MSVENIINYCKQQSRGFTVSKWNAHSSIYKDVETLMTQKGNSAYTLNIPDNPNKNIVVSPSSSGSGMYEITFIDLTTNTASGGGRRRRKKSPSTKSSSSSGYVKKGGKTKKSRSRKRSRSKKGKKRY